MKIIGFSLLLFYHSLSASLYDFGYSPPSQIDISSPRDFSIYADAMMVKAVEDGLDFADNDSNLATSPLIGFSTDHIDYNYNPGARLGLLFFMGEDRWDIDICWTWTKAANTKNINTSAVVFPAWLLQAGVNSTAQSARASWDLNFNLLDARIGKWFHLIESLLAHPHFGVIVAFVDQHYAVAYGSVLGSLERAIPQLESDFAGVGLRGGFDTEWKLDKFWFLFGNVAASLLWSQIQIEQSFFQGRVSIYDIAEEFNGKTPNLDLSLGLGWGRSFYHSKFYFGAKLGLEYSKWWDMFQLRRFFSSNGAGNNTINRGDFSLKGLFLRIQGDF